MDTAQMARRVGCWRLGLFNQMNAPLTKEQELEILRWVHKNPEADLDNQIKEWKIKFNCSEFSIIQTFVKEQLGQISVNE